MWVIAAVAVWTVVLLVAGIVRLRRKLEDARAYAEHWQWRAHQEFRWRLMAEIDRDHMEQVVKARTDKMFRVRKSRGDAGPN